jgi:alpha-L-fucosidase 2
MERAAITYQQINYLEKNMKKTLFIFVFSFLSIVQGTDKFDMKWTQVPSSYIEGAILGNGEQGTMIWARPKESLHFDIGDTRIYDETNRVGIGKFILKTTAERTAFEMQHSLENAEAVGTVTTSKGKVHFRAISVSDQNLNLVKFKIEGSEKIAIDHFAIPGLNTGKLRNAIKEFTGKPTHTISDYSNPAYTEAIAKTIEKYKLPEEFNEDRGGINLRLVSLKQGKAYALNWSLKDLGKKEFLLAWRTDYTRENIKLAEQKAWAQEKSEELRTAISASYEVYFAKHVKWWNQYFQRSAISLPDKKLEAYYKWQLYKVAAATRKGKLPIDLMGPWFRATNWPKIWANLNVQLTYLPMAVANQPEIASTLFDLIDNRPELFTEAAGKFKADSATHARAISPYTPGGFSWEYGNFLWTLHNYWHFLKVYPDAERTKTKFYPMLKRGINYVLHHCREDEKGVLHTPKDISPEYEINKVFPKVEDTTYNLEFMRWALSTLIYIEEQYSLQDPQIGKYKSALENLAPTLLDDESGIMIGQGVKLEKAHRHYSHLVGLYPTKQMNLNDPDQFKLAARAVNYWINLPILNSWSYKGYSRTGAASMYAMLGQGDKAYDQMKIYMKTYGSANTMYIESGPVIETPISAVASIHEMLFQCNSLDFKKDEIKVFTGVPSAWKNVSFENLKAEGGYTISARREAGKLVAFKLLSSQERDLSLKLPGTNVIQSSKEGSLKLIKGRLEIKLRADESLSFGDQRSFAKPVESLDGKASYHFGLN